MEWNWEIIMALLTAVLTVVGIFVPNLNGVFDTIIKLLGGK